MQRKHLFLFRYVLLPAGGLANSLATEPGKGQVGDPPSGNSYRKAMAKSDKQKRAPNCPLCSCIALIYKHILLGRIGLSPAVSPSFHISSGAIFQVWKIGGPNRRRMVGPAAGLPTAGSSSLASHANGQSGCFSCNIRLPLLTTTVRQASRGKSFDLKIHHSLKSRSIAEQVCEVKLRP